MVFGQTFGGCFLRPRDSAEDTCSLRPRGWTSAVRHGRSARLLLPACAGDGPVPARLARPALSCSLRVRGWPLRDAPLWLWLALLPASVGMDPSTGPGSRFPETAPRTCGDGSFGEFVGQADDVASPRVRGMVWLARPVSPRWPPAFPYLRGWIRRRLGRPPRRDPLPAHAGAVPGRWTGERKCWAASRGLRGMCRFSPLATQAVPAGQHLFLCLRATEQPLSLTSVAFPHGLPVGSALVWPAAGPSEIVVVAAAQWESACCPSLMPPSCEPGLA